MATALSAAMVLLASCTTDADLASMGNGRQISFNSGVMPAASRAASEVVAADTFSLSAADGPTLMCTSHTEPITGIESRATEVTAGDQIAEMGVIAHASWFAPLLMNNDLYRRNAQGIFQSDEVRYWVDEDNATVDFYAFYPYNPDGLTLPATRESTVLSYTVAQTATAQSDLLLAQRKGVDGNFNNTVGLSFRHLLSQVRVTFASRPQGWAVKSVSFAGVHRSGTLDFAAESPGWSYTDAADNIIEAETDPPGDALFMTLPMEASAERPVTMTVVVNDGTADRTYTREIPTARWTMGNKTTYTITLANYGLEFVTAPPAQDAHYVMCPLRINASGDLPGGGWTLTSNEPDNVTFVEKSKIDAALQTLVEQGYWLEDNSGVGFVKSSTLESTTKGDVDIYVFIAENIGDADRQITLSLRPSGGSSAAKQLTFSQYCPAWNGNLGVERLQEKDYPWGFNWDSSMKVTYSMPGGFWAGIIHVLFRWFGNKSYIEDTGSAWGGTWKVTVDFSKVPKLTTATNTGDGLTNTWEIYTFNGVNDAQSIMDQLESWGGKPDRALPTNPAEFAARACAMKNPHKITTESSSETTAYLPELDQAKMVWYLPAQDEAPSMRDNLFGLSGDYWTSTSITEPGTTAYKYTVGGGASPQNRNDNLHVRAVRRR